MKRFLSLLISVGLIFGLTQPSTALNDSTELTIHYVRGEADYAGWNLWLWPKGSDGKAYNFTESDSFGRVAKVVVPGTANVSEIGIIVRLEDWKAKDVSQDRFITQFPGGKAEIWLVQGDPEIYYQKPEITTKIISAEVTSFTSINLTLNSRINPSRVAENLKVSVGERSVPVKGAQSIPRGSTSSARVSIELAGSLDFSGAIVVTHPDFGSRNADSGALFSTREFEDAFHYEGSDLGASYSETATKFRLWAPTTTAAQLVTYASANGATPRAVIDMAKGPRGTWTAELPGNQHLTIYNYRVWLDGRWVEAVDPYARAAVVNGDRGVVVDLAKTNPEGWSSHSKPKFSGKPTDAVFYELHVRDLSMDPNSGIKSKGKFIGLTEAGTTTPDGKTKTGIDAIVDLGVTHLQLLPIYDYKTVDELRNDQFNWGYDPLNYNVPEGSYATDPTDPLNRIRELKQTIQYLHSRGLNVVMDVVYNHVFDAGSHSFERFVPGYFFRKEADGSFANGTGVGNEIASERSMARKYIVESSSYWAQEYKLDGFRYDLMGIQDVDTMNQVRAAISKIDPKFIIIGEGWVMGDKLSPSMKANQMNAWKMPGIAHFNDGIRDGLKGSVFNESEQGWASGLDKFKTKVMVGIAGQIQLTTLLQGGWGEIQPSQAVSYVEAHDNMTLHDKLLVSMPSVSSAVRTRVFALASSTAILAQGVTFIHAGQEFMRSKDGDANSYKSSDQVNSLKWLKRQENSSMVAYFKGLLEIRKQHPMFRTDSAAELRRILKFSSTPSDLITYSLKDWRKVSKQKQLYVIHNASAKSTSVKLPLKGRWTVLAEGIRAKATGLRVLASAQSVTVTPQSTMVLRLER